MKIQIEGKELLQLAGQCSLNNFTLQVAVAAAKCFAPDLASLQEAKTYPLPFAAFVLRTKALITLKNTYPAWQKGAIDIKP